MIVLRSLSGHLAVKLSALLHAPNTRSLIEGLDLLSACPSGVTPKQLKELHIKLDLPPA